MRWTGWIAMAVGLILADPAFACRRHYTNAERIVPVVQQHFDAVVVVEVVARTGELGEPWRTVGRRTATVAEGPASEIYEFQGGDVFDSCGALFGPPVKGEAWVLYLNRRGDAWTVAALYPWNVVFEHDARFREGQRPMPKLTADGLVPTAR